MSTRVPWYTSWRTLLGRRPRPPKLDFSEAPDEMLGGNRLTLLHDGRQAYPAMLAAIAEAQDTIHLETYSLASDRTGWKFASLLAEKARAAVEVRVIFDSVGSLGVAPQFLQFLRNNGISLLEYRPLSPWRRRWGWSRRDHRKILVVDASIGFAGGINISDEYAEPSEGGGGWRDTDVKIEGPAAYELDRLFRQTWFKETGRWFGLEGHPDRAVGPSIVRVAANQEFLYRHRIRRAYLRNLRRARRNVSIANAYFIPDPASQRALRAASRRGVEVKILVPGPSDVPAAAFASHYCYEALLRDGVRIYEWPHPMLHSKTIVIDGVWSVVGSYNLDHRSWLHDLEVNIHVIDYDFGRRMEEAFRQDIAMAREVTLRDWRLRPWREKLLEQIFYSVRYWL